MATRSRPFDWASRLLIWFDAHRRELPWRTSRDPYRIWISEVMLQQTTVATVIPYFERFLKAFPTVRALAEADEQAVLRLWEGLGYYRRARDLHRAARQLTASHGAELPDDPAVWAVLPGVGPYILGAVLSQAFDRPLPIIEANSQRVLCRVFAQEGDPSSGPVRRWLWQKAAELVPAQRAGDFNQALMELGSLICRPVAPLCGQCPWASVCQARHRGEPERFPLRRPRQPPTSVAEVGLILRKRSRLLLVQRSALARRWANLWEFPHGEQDSQETVETAAHRVLGKLTGFTARLGSEMRTITHTVTRYRIRMLMLEAEWTGGRFASTLYTAARWVWPSQLNRYPVSAAQRRIMKCLSEGRKRHAVEKDGLGQN